MAVMVIGNVPGGTAEQDQELLERMGLAQNPPAGVLARFAGPVASGWRIVSVWESREAWETFRRERLEPALRDAGRPAPDVELSDLHSVRLPAVGQVPQAG